MTFALFVALNAIFLFFLFERYSNKSKLKSVFAGLVLIAFGIFLSGLFIHFFRETGIKIIVEKLLNAWQWKSFFVRFVFLCVFMEIVVFLLEIFPSKKNLNLNLKQGGGSFAGIVIQIIGICLFWAVRRACKTYPIVSEPVTVYYTLTTINGTFDKNIISLIVLIISVSTLLVAFCNFSVLYLHTFLKSGKQKPINITPLFFIFSVCFAIILLGVAIKPIPFSEYYKISQKLKLPPEKSEFYESEYVKPEYENIVFPEKKRNLVILLCESMESSYADKENGGLFEQNLIPNLTRIAKENVNFSNGLLLGGGVDVSGTGWTVAAMTAKFSGLPFNFSVGTGNFSGLPEFLPNAITLTDILAEKGYKQRYIFGSRDTLLETHGNVEVHDIAWYKEHGMLEKDYSVFWGFEDQKLFEYAKYELEDLSSQGEPFMFGLLTVDTHPVEGYVCQSCENEFDDFQMKNVIRCSDRQISEFVQWCQSQEWYENTTIVIMGDHLFMVGADNNFFGDAFRTTQSESKNVNGHKNSYSIKSQRHWLDIFINSSADYDSGSTKNREFSSLDMFPTILAAMGCKIKDDRLGFGTNLFSGKETLVERYDKATLNKELMTNNTTYAYLEGRKLEE